MERPRLQRSISERPAPLRRSGSLFGLLSRVPPFRNSAWGIDDCDDYTSSEDEPPAPPSPTISPEEAKVSEGKERVVTAFLNRFSCVLDYCFSVKKMVRESRKMHPLAIHHFIVTTTVSSSYTLFCDPHLAELGYASLGQGSRHRPAGYA